MQHDNGLTLRDDGWWWPAYARDPEKCLDYVNHRIADMDPAISFCKKHRICVQAGGHIGLWPLRLSDVFQCVYTFECEPLLAECVRRNCAKKQNIIISPYALGEEVGQARLRPSASAGSARIEPDGRQIVPVTTIDRMQLKRCDALFLDVEAYEVPVLKGAKETIERCQPVIHVEELPRAKQAIQDHMRSINYRLVKTIHADSVYVPR